MLAALSKGAHLRVGMEDVLTLRKGVPVESNAQLVSRAVELARVVDRFPVSGERARDMLQVRKA